jgi:predicted transcriptional regulator
MMTSKKITASEEAIMQIIWKLGQGFAQDIMSEIPEPKPPYNTTLSVVKALERKGYVAHETFGKANRYYPLISKEDYSRSLLGRVVSNYFNNSLSSLVSAFTEDHSISEKELKDLERLVEKAKRSNV